MSLLLALSGTPTNYTITALGGSYVVSGASAAITKGRVLTAQGGAYLVTGSDATITTTEIVQDTPDGYWYKQWEKLHKKNQKLEDVIELVQERPATALAEVKEAVKREYPSIDYTQVAWNVELQRFIAQQILIALELRRIQDDEEDIEILLLL